jgi:hypothetical protein
VPENKVKEENSDHDKATHPKKVLETLADLSQFGPVYYPPSLFRG